MVAKTKRDTSTDQRNHVGRTNMSSFTTQELVLVKIESDSPRSVVSNVMDFIGANKLYSVHSMAIGGGKYVALHTPEDAARIAAHLRDLGVHEVQNG
jgi:hypothetical protein